MKWVCPKCGSTKLIVSRFMCTMEYSAEIADDQVVVDFNMGNASSVGDEEQVICAGCDSYLDISTDWNGHIRNIEVNKSWEALDNK